MKILKKISFIVMMILLVSCSNHWILDQERIDELPDVASYAKKLQDENAGYSEISAYTVFTISEGRRMVVISSGNESKALEFVSMDVEKKNQKVIVKEIINESGDINPYLLVGLDKITGDLQVYNESTGEFITEVDRIMNPIN